MKSDRITCRFIQYTMDIMYQNIIQDISIACMHALYGFDNNDYNIKIYYIHRLYIIASAHIIYDSQLYNLYWSI